jgi:hypothetical protein
MCCKARATSSRTSDCSLPLLFFLQPQNNPNVESGSGINTYTQNVAYGASQAAITTGTKFFPTTYTTATQPLIIGNVNNEIYSSSIPLFLVNVISNFCSPSDNVGTCTSRCSNTYSGSYNAAQRTCTTWFTLNSICFVIDPATGDLDQSWTAGNGNAGCQDLAYQGLPQSLWGQAFANNGVGPFGYTASSSQPNSVSWSSLRVTIRSSGDPWVQANRLTSGNPGSFGLSTASKVAIGLGLIFGGLGVCAFVVLVAWCLVRSMRKREGHHHHGGSQYVAVPSQPQQVVVVSQAGPNPFSQPQTVMPYPQAAYAPPGSMPVQYAPQGMPMAGQYGAPQQSPFATQY